MKNYVTPIRRDKVKSAIAESEELKDNLLSTYRSAQENQKSVASLASKSQSLAIGSKKMYEKSSKIETHERRKNFFLCSRKCLIGVGVLALLVAIVILVIVFLNK